MRAAFAPCAGLLLVLLAGSQCAPRKLASADREQGRQAVIYFGEWIELHFGEWIFKKEPPALPQALRYEVRRSSASPEGELLFTVKAETPEGEAMQEWYESAPNKPSEAFGFNYCAVSPAPEPRSRTASEQEWQQAKPVLHSRRRIQSNGGASSTEPNTQTERGVVFRNREYAKSGASWGETIALVSPAQKWLAVFSYTSRQSSVEKVEVPEGEFYWDVYDISSGERVLKGYAPFSSRTPGKQFSTVVWIEDRYLIIPLESSLDTCLMGIMPTH